MKYRAEIDGLRAVAVVPVVLFHADVPGFSGGFLGVDVFFVISGFLITSIVAKQAREGRFSLTTFYERRARRLMPALFAVLLAVVGMGVVFAPPFALYELGESLIGVCVYMSNILFLHRIDYFAEDAELNPLLHTWSLSVEEQFYVLFPMSLAIAIRYRPTLARWFVVAAMGASFLLGQWMSSARPDWGFYLLPPRGWELLAGATLALFPELRVRLRSAVLDEGLPVLGLVLVAVPMALYDSHTPTPGIWTALPVLGSVLLLGWAGPGNLVGRLLSRPGVVHIGMIPYSVYLWHQPLLAFQRHASVWRPDPVLTAVLVVASFVLGHLSWRLIENPFRLHGYFRPSRVFATTFAGSVVTCLLGAGLIASGGWPQRYGVGAREAFALSQAPNPGKHCQRSGSTPLDAPYCRLGLKDGPADALLVGDSHSAAISAPLADLAVAERLRIDQTSFGACPPAFGLQRLLPQSRRNCEAHNERVFTLAAGADVNTIILAARWNLAIHGSVQTDRCIESHKQPPQSIDHEALAVLEQSLKRWLSLEKPVVLVLPVPTYGCNVPSTIGKLRSQGGGPFVRPRADVVARSAAFRAIVDRLDNDHLTVIDPLERLCDDTTCFTEVDGQIAYRDDDHLSPAGGRLVVDQLAPHLR